EKPNLFACHCGEGFLSRALLIEHKKVHVTSRDCIFRCSICQAKFHSHRTYDQHLISHFGLNRRLCAFCGQSLSSKIEFNKHIQTVHEKPSGPTQYSCIVCNEGFHHTAMLEEHQKYHNKQKPFRCPICFSQFQEYTTYTGHLTQHVGKNTKICFMCGYRTSTCRTLTIHFKSH
ncbi:hypothetical protein LOTGIDRAFT_97000, partial [Lottia gigantea]